MHKHLRPTKCTCEHPQLLTAHFVPHPLTLISGGRAEVSTDTPRGLVIHRCVTNQPKTQWLTLRIYFAHSLGRVGQAQLSSAAHAISWGSSTGPEDPLPRWPPHTAGKLESLPAGNSARIVGLGSPSHEPRLKLELHHSMTTGFQEPRRKLQGFL